MAGLDLAKKLVSEEGRAAVRQELAQRSAARPAVVSIARPPERARAARSVTALAELPAPPDWNRHVVAGTALDQIWAFLNPVMLYGKHLGLKGPLVRDLQSAA